MQKIKAHIKKYKTHYLVVGTALGAAGFTWLIMRDRHATALRPVDGLETADTSVTMRPLSFFSSQKNDFVTTIHTGTRGNPGFVTRNIETDQCFRTQADAARAFGINPSNLSQHLNGNYEHADGLHFERVQYAA